MLIIVVGNTKNYIISNGYYTKDEQRVPSLLFVALLSIITRATTKPCFFFFFLRINYKTMYMMLTSCHKSLDENWPWWILVWLLLPHLLSFLHYLFQLEHLSLSFSLSHRDFILRTWKKLKLSHVPLEIMVPFRIRVQIYVFSF